MTSLHRRRSALPVFTVLALGTTLALAGCATTDTAEEAVEATDTAAAQAAPERVASGVTGEIADVADGLMQVQDTESQTAVSYTDDTTITAQVSGSLSDLEVGDCVFVTTDAADATVATLVTVTAAVDGECGIAGFAAGSNSRLGVGRDAVRAEAGRGNQQRRQRRQRRQRGFRKILEPQGRRGIGRQIIPRPDPRGLGPFFLPKPGTLKTRPR